MCRRSAPLRYPSILASEWFTRDDGAIPRALAQAVGCTLELAAILLSTRLDLQLQGRDALGVAAVRSRLPPHGVELPPQARALQLKPVELTVGGFQLLLERRVPLGRLGEIRRRTRVRVLVRQFGITELALDDGSSGRGV